MVKFLLGRCREILPFSAPPCLELPQVSEANGGGSQRDQDGAQGAPEAAPRSPRMSPRDSHHRPGKHQSHLMGGDEEGDHLGTAESPRHLRTVDDSPRNSPMSPSRGSERHTMRAIIDEAHNVEGQGRQDSPRSPRDLMGHRVAGTLAQEYVRSIVVT